MRIPLLILMLLAWLIGGAYLWNKLECCGLNAALAPVSNGEAAVTPVVPAVKKNTLRLDIADGNLFKVGADDDLRFEQSGFSYKNRPLGSNLEEIFRKTGEYLKTNPEKSLLLTGLYKGDETNKSALPDLGLARATNVKNIMTGFGANPAQIELSSEKKAVLKIDEGDVVGAIKYRFGDLKKEDSRLIAVEKMLKAKPRVLYFESNKDQVVLDPELRQYFADLMYYMDRKPNVQVNCTGHTDSQGYRKDNMKLGAGRADFVRSYLAKNGAKAKQISTLSKGPDQPIGSNSTAAGRAKNRRVEISIN